eukprot:1157441-Pelagomonas_calceolata.AAC.10
MCMKNHLHAELIRAISHVLERSPHPVDFLKAHSGIIGNEGADACARNTALMDTTVLSFKMPGIPFTTYWLLLKSSYGCNIDAHHSHTAPTHYLTNLTDKIQVCYKL